MLIHYASQVAEFDVDGLILTRLPLPERIPGRTSARAGVLPEVEDLLGDVVVLVGAQAFQEVGKRE